MEATIVGTEEKIDELLVVLDENIRNMRESLSRLDELRGLVVKHDEPALAQLCETIRAESDSYRNCELKRQSMRKELAVILGCDIEHVTLSRFEGILAGEKKAQVAKKKAELRSLAGKLKKEHLKTTMLLSDCARFNGALLRGVLELGRTGAITYTSDGSTKAQAETGFVNLQG